MSVFFHLYFKATMYTRTMPVQQIPVTITNFERNDIVTNILKQIPMESSAHWNYMRFFPKTVSFPYQYNISLIKFVRHQCCRSRHRYDDISI